jgi:hypothetical protein
LLWLVVVVVDGDGREGTKVVIAVGSRQRPCFGDGKTKLRSLKIHTPRVPVSVLLNVPLLLFAMPQLSLALLLLVLPLLVLLPLAVLALHTLPTLAHASDSRCTGHVECRRTRHAPKVECTQSD